MSLQKLLNLSCDKFKKDEVTEARVLKHIDVIRKYIAYFREYPDLLLDFLVEASGEECKFKGLYFYQRVFLRAAMRHRYVFCTFPRAYSKSFLGVLILMLRCILYPGADLFVCTGGKEQATRITQQKLNEWLDLVPALRNEIDWKSKETSPNGKDMVSYKFHSGAKLSIVALNEKSRGLRKTGGLVEEVITVDQKIFSEVVIPMMNVSRTIPDGTKNELDVVNKSQIYVTSAGYKKSFAYDKLLFLLIKSILDPSQAFVMGGTYKVPIKEGLLEKTFVRDIQEDPTFNMDSFDREYKSEWSGSYEGSFLDPSVVELSRVLKKAEDKADIPKKIPFYYIFSLDFGRYDCTTEITVIKVYPKENSESVKKIVNIYSLSSENTTFQAVTLHELYEKFHPETVVIDANGNGMSLLDVLVLPFTDPRTGKQYESWGLINDDKNYYTNKYIDTPRMLIYQIKATETIDDEADRALKDQFRLGKLLLLISEKEASQKIELSSTLCKLSTLEKKKFLRPYALSDGLQDQLLNLVDVNQDKIAAKVKTDRINTNVGTDRYKALAYGIYYLRKKEREEGFGIGRTFSLSDIMCF